MRRDKLLQSIFITLVGWPFAEGFTWTMKFFGFTNITALEAISMMWMKEPNWVLGILAALGFNAWVTIFIYYSPKIWGTDYFPIKAMLLTMTSESLLFNIFGVLNNNPLMIQDTIGNYVHALTAAMGGLTSGFLIQKFVFKINPKKSSKKRLLNRKKTRKSASFVF